VRGQAFSDEFALCFGDWKAILVRDDSVPERPDVSNLFVRRQLIEPRRRTGDGVGHEARMPRTVVRDKDAGRVQLSQESRLGVGQKRASFRSRASEKNHKSS
jgi:hypothetical protein